MTSPECSPETSARLKGVVKECSLALSLVEPVVKSFVPSLLKEKPVAPLLPSEEETL